MVGELRVKVLVNSLLSYLHHTMYHLAAGALQQQLLPAAGHRGGGEGPGRLIRHTRTGEAFEYVERAEQYPAPLFPSFLGIVVTIWCLTTDHTIRCTCCLTTQGRTPSRCWPVPTLATVRHSASRWVIFCYFYYLKTFLWNTPLIICFQSDWWGWGCGW